jgi:hypothetical protein
MRHCTTNATLLKSFATVMKYRTEEVRQWLRTQDHYPAKPHFYSWMLSWTAQLEDMPNVFNLRNDGARECFGCAITCAGDAAYPRVQHLDRQQEHIGTTPFAGVASMSGLAPSDLFAPYASQPVFTQQNDSVTRAGNSERTIDFMFMGTTARDFSSVWVRGNISRLFATHRAAFNFTVALQGDDYAKAMYTSKYCFCPRGDDSSSGRLFDAVAAGCVPIIVSDALVVAFAGSVDWESFTLRLPECAFRDVAQHSRTAIALSAMLDPKIYSRLQRNLLRHRAKVIYSNGNPFSPQYRANPALVNVMMGEMALVAANSTAFHTALPVYDPFRDPLTATAVMMSPAQCPYLRHPRPAAAPAVAFKSGRGGGRLGNQIFQYAAVRGITQYYGTPVTAALAGPTAAGERAFTCGANPNPFGQKLMEFRSKDPSFAPDFRKSWEDGLGKWDNRTLQYTTATKLQSYFQSWRYFCNILPDILSELTHFFNECHGGPAALERLLRTAKVDPTTTTAIGVHLRLGDIVATDPRGESTWTVTPGWLRRALTRLGGLLPQQQDLALVVFCGDFRPEQRALCESLIGVIRELEWGSGRIATTIMVPHTAEHTPEVDMAIMSACNHVVITWGSYGYWPALVVNSRGGHAIAPTEPFRGQWADEVNSADFYPPMFVQVNNSESDSAPLTAASLLSVGQTIVDDLQKKWLVTQSDVETCAGVRNASKEWYGNLNPQTELYRCVSRNPPHAWEYGRYHCDAVGCMPPRRPP